MNGHPFARPGQVAAHLPAPDNCMQCGEPEATHAAATFVRPDGSALLTRQDRLTVLGAIATAAEYLEHRAGLICANCEADVAEICDEHASDLDAASEYRAVANRLGDDGDR